MSIRDSRAVLLIMLAVILCSVSSAEAGKRQCANDYRRFCSQWGLKPEVWKTVCAGMATI